MLSETQIGLDIYQLMHEHQHSQTNAYPPDELFAAQAFKHDWQLIPERCQTIVLHEVECKDVEIAD